MKIYVLSLAAVMTLAPAVATTMEEGTKLAQAMKNELGGVLWPTFYNEGPMAALHTCHEQAQEIADNHSNKNVTVSRISHRSRNLDNAVPDYLAEQYQQLFDAYNDSNGNLTNTEFKTNNDEQVELIAISTSTQCLACHGESIDDALAKEILRLYPNDQAINFVEEDMRGAFVIHWSQSR
ncbi:MAG: DUF3365 domain-containing protein [Idiomarina sp.]|nr:DUF3365 domain-containing protein [Idiomarina sp.]